MKTKQQPLCHRNFQNFNCDFALSQFSPILSRATPITAPRSSKCLLSYCICFFVFVLIVIYFLINFTYLGFKDLIWMLVFMIVNDKLS